MSQNTPRRSMRELAERLVAYENAAAHCSGEKTPALFPVCEKLRGSLSTLAGVTGFRTLLARALTLVKPQAPVLSGLNVNQEGSLDVLNGVPEAEMPQMQTLLVAQLLELLAVFIGETLAVRLVMDVWPDLLPIADAELKMDVQT